MQRLTLTSCVLLSTLVVADPTESTLKLDFEQIEVPIHARAQKRFAEFGVPIYNNFSWQQYTIEAAVGTPPQSFRFLLDTGSADLWVPSPDSRACTPHCPPTFDRSKSSTYRDTGLPFNVSYGLSPTGPALYGPYFNDTLRFGLAVIENMTIGLGNVPSLLFDIGNFGILALGPPAQESLVNNQASPDFNMLNKTYPVLYEQLFNAGYIKKRLFSLWLDRKRANYGSVLFGGIDESKFHGKIQYEPIARRHFPDWEVNLTSIVLGNGRLETAILLQTITTVIDSGSPNMYLPPDVADAFAKSLNATMVNGYNGPFPYVDCHAGKDQYLEFGFSAGLKIKVPARDVIYPFADPVNVGPKYSSDGKRLCYLGLQASAAPTFLLGNTFQRSAYIVFDADNKQIGMASVRY